MCAPLVTRAARPVSTSQLLPLIIDTDIDDRPGVSVAVLVWSWCGCGPGPERGPGLGPGRRKPRVRPRIEDRGRMLEKLNWELIIEDGEPCSENRESRVIGIHATGTRNS